MIASISQGMHMETKGHHSLEDEFSYYRANQDEFVARYDGKVIVLKDNQVIGCFETEMDAVIETRKTHERGTFLVQRVSQGEGAYTATYHSPMVVFQ
jgi:hypothetical protein